MNHNLHEMKRELLIGFFLLLTGTLAAQQLVLGTHDVVRLGEYPEDAYLVEADATGFYRVSAGYSTSSDHPLLSQALNPDFRSIYFIRYDSDGTPLKSNYVRGGTDIRFAGSFNGGLILMADASEQVDASGTIIPIPASSEVEFLAKYDRDCQLLKIINIWSLTANQYVNSSAAMDPADGSVYVYGTSSFPAYLNGYGYLGQGLSPTYFYVIKYSQTLNFQWVYQFGFDMGQSGTSPYFNNVQVFPGLGGGALITGVYATESSPLIMGKSLPPYLDGYGTFAVPLDGTGQPQWVLDGTLGNYGYASRIFKAFPLRGGDFVLAGNTNTGSYSLGEVSFNFPDSQTNNQFVFRLDPSGNPVWTRQFDSQGPVQEGKKKSVSSTLLEDNIYYDAITWKNRLLYLTSTFTNSAFSPAGTTLNRTYPLGVYLAALDMRDGSVLWGYALSSDDAEIYGFDVDRSGNASLMGYNYTTQDLDGVNGEAIIPGKSIFHVGLDYSGQPLWYINANISTPPYYDLYGTDLEVLPDGEVFASLKMASANNLVIGESAVSELTSTYSSWLVELASDVVLGGKVTDADQNPVYPGYVKAIKSAWWGIYPEVDSVPLAADGSFVFEDLYPGNYTLLAVPDKDQYPDYVPTYFGNQTGWKSAPFNDLYPKFNSNIVNIQLVEVPRLTPGDGSGEVSGTISYADDVEDVRKSILARPAKKASVVLLEKTKKSTMAGDVVAYLETDDYGMFSFSNVPDGDYILHVEVPGLDMLEIHEVTIVGDQIVSGMDYTISEDGIYIGWPLGTPQPETVNLQIYPNPGTGLIQMDLPVAGSYRVRVYATDGRMALDEQFESAGGARSIRIPGEDRGIYLIRVQGPGIDETIKYVKQ